MVKASEIRLTFLFNSIKSVSLPIKREALGAMLYTANEYLLSRDLPGDYDEQLNVVQRNFHAPTVGYDVYDYLVEIFEVFGQPQAVALASRDPRQIHQAQQTANEYLADEKFRKISRERIKQLRP